MDNDNVCKGRKHVHGSEMRQPFGLFSMTFHDFPLSRPNSMTLQAWKMWILNSTPGTVRTLKPNSRLIFHIRHDTHTCCWCPENLRAELEMACFTFSSRRLRLTTGSCLGSICAVLSNSAIARHSGTLQQNGTNDDGQKPLLGSSDISYNVLLDGC